MTRSQPRLDKPNGSAADIEVVEPMNHSPSPNRQEIADWLPILDLVACVGVADRGQMQSAIGITRHRLDRLLTDLEQAPPDDDAPLARVADSVLRPGSKGRAPIVFRLTERGAAILRAHGHAHARGCGLSDPVAIAHALATLDVRLAANKAGLSVETEHPLPYGDGQVLRPDNLVTLPDGTLALFETEQVARPTTLRRIVESLQHKLAFYQAADRADVSPIVRVLFTIPRGAELERTLRTWRHALQVVAGENDGRLPFRLLARPLLEFVEAPDWSEPPERSRWLAVEPATLSSETRSQETALAPRSALPVELQRRSLRQDRLILAAFWQVFQEEEWTGRNDGQFPQPQADFFDLVGLIYAAGHDPQAPARIQAAVPYASIYLLREYLRLRPDLRRRLHDALAGSARMMNWNTTLVLHRMQVVIDAFLAAHGWTSDGPLVAHPMVASWEQDGPRSFGVHVQVRAKELLMASESGVVPTESEVRQAEVALAWVLRALFAHSQEIGLPRPAFW
jgi:hypothetical protein